MPTLEPLPVPVSVSTGARIGGRYAVLDVLGRGGMGEVYRVRDETGGRELALKRLRHDHCAGGAMLPSQFEREFHTLAQLEHPCVIKVYDYGVDDAGAYYTMELVHGHDLRQRELMSWRETCRVLRDLASALALMHSRRWLHRDLSPRNVMRCDDGTTRLIDFGAMAHMGICRTLVGTPPLVPPEAAALQALDGRTDLYSLGALGYRLLSGRHAYPARTFVQLRDLWRTPPPPLPQLIGELPVGLCRLIDELLSLERGARPGTASEVLERIGALLGEGERCAPDVGAAYLTIPKLVGRARSLAKVRRHLLRCLPARGGVILVAGEAGSGRSRFLDACVLNAKLLGATVLRADASDADRGAYGVAAAIADQLSLALPSAAKSAARLRLPWLSAVIPSLDAAQPLRDASQRSAAPRRQLQTALRDWFRAVSRDNRIVVAIDELEAVDEPSAALLAALVEPAKARRLTLIASVAIGQGSHQLIELLRDNALVVELSPLRASDTEALLGSVFGTCRNLAALTQRVHELSRGSPRRIMQLCEHLVSIGRARFSAGTWLLPERLSAEDLPASIDAAARERIERLGEGAAILARVLSLTDPARLTVDQLGLLHAAASGREPSDVFAALADLVAAGVLQMQAERYRFVERRSCELLSERLTDAERSAFHGHLVALAEHMHDSLALAGHLMQSGRAERAIDVLLSAPERRDDVRSASLIPLLESAVSAADQLVLPLRKRLALRGWLCSVAGLTGLHDLFVRHAKVVFPLLEQAAGLNDIGALAATRCEQRLACAVALAQARNDAAPQAERAPDPCEATRELARLSCVTLALACGGLDARLIDALPSLAPLAPISPAADLIELCKVGCRHIHAGRSSRARSIWNELLARIDACSPRDEADRGMQRRAHSAALLMLAHCEVMHAGPRAPRVLCELSEQPGERANALRLQATHHSMQGDLDARRACERRAALCALQEGLSESHPDMNLLGEAIACALSDDLNGLKQVLGALTPHAAVLAGWQPVLSFVQGHCQRLCGDLGSALRLSESLVMSSPPASHCLSAWFASLHTWLLLQSGDVDTAAACGLNYLEAFRARDCDVTDTFDLARATAEALARQGRTQEAVSLAEEVIEALASAEFAGIALGAAYETRAHVAQAGRDRAGFLHWLERCAAYYTAHDNPALTAKHGRLVQRGRSEGWLHTQPPQAPAEDDVTLSGARCHQLTSSSRLRECVDAAERSRCALLIMLEHSGATEGHLYGFIAGRLSRLASVPNTAPDENLTDLLQRRVDKLCDAAEVTATSGADDDSVDGPECARLLQRFQPLLLCSARDGERSIAAMAALAGDGALEAVPVNVLAMLAETLLDHHDVDATTVVF